ncbi:MAG TPA: thioredoxin family protein [Erysipelotrichaceae bacterium]|nr:thioredoxin family protein [Erysipelotrichaceae bacterium]
MEIKILGSGCKKCGKLEANVNEALKTLNLSANVEKVTDVVEITSYGVMQTPALVINKEVVAYGKLLSVKDIVKIISK